MLEALKNKVYEANIKLVEYGLVTLTWGNASGIDRESGLVVIKPSGVSYDEMKPSDMVVVRLSDGKIVEGDLNPSSDTPTHLEFYRHFPNVGGAVHTHSTYATAFAQAKKGIPALGTTHADHFYGDIPCTRDMTDDEICGEYEKNTGLVIVETFKDKDPLSVPSVLVASHGVFSFGSDAVKAVENALVTERCAQMALIGGLVGGDYAPIAKTLLDKHFLRKHGKNAYYGQKKKELSGAESRFLELKKSEGTCASCGREHKLSLECLVMHSGAISELEATVNKIGDFENIVMICDTNTYEAAGKTVENSGLKLTKTVILDANGLHANEHGVELADTATPKNCDLLLAVGSGTIHDITRYVAYTRGLDFISVPTAASVDGFVSTVAAMTWKGVKRTLTAVGPIAMVADTDIISKAPNDLTAAGVGDLLGKYISLTEWKIGKLLTDEYYCAEIVKLMEEAVTEVASNIEKIAEADTDGIEKLMYGLVLSGLAMQMAGNSRPASGAEHHISHLIEMGALFGQNDTYHGEKVGVATALVADKYHEIAKLNAVDVKFSMDNTVGQDELVEVFGDLSDEILKENRNDPLLNVNEARLIECWDEIKALVATIPSGDEIRKLIGMCGGSVELSEIDIPNDAHTRLFRYSPLVRNRLTLMRIYGGMEK